MKLEFFNNPNLALFSRFKKTNQLLFEKLALKKIHDHFNHLVSLFNPHPWSYEGECGK
jgi:hypothetical protein